MCSLGRPQCCTLTLINVLGGIVLQRRLEGGSMCLLSPVPPLIIGTPLLQAHIKAPQDMAVVKELQNLSPCTQPQIE